MEINELRIIDRCQKGDLEEFDKLYAQYVEKLYRFIYYKTLHKETAEDLTSAVFLKALNRIQAYSPSQGSFSSWLFRIGRNTVIDYYRTNHPFADLEDAWGITSGENIHRDTENRDLLAQVEEYMKTLKAEQREVIMLRVWEGMSYKEVAEIMGKSEAGCKMAFSRAVSKIQKEFSLSALLLIILFTHL